MRNIRSKRDVFNGILAFVDKYTLRITGNRVSDWSLNGTLKMAGYTFNGSTAVTDNNSFNFTIQGAADSTGGLLIGGRAAASVAGPTGNNTHNVFINGFQISPVPEPSTMALAGAAASAALALRRRRGRTGPQTT